jgi:amino acid transporter
MTEARNASGDRVNYWQELGEELRARLSGPLRHPTFIMYFVGIIMIIGGLGLLPPIVGLLLGNLRHDAFLQALTSATYTYFLAITATAAVDFILSYRQRKYLLMFFLFLSLVVVLCALFAAIFGTLRSNPDTVLYPTAIGYLLALALWWIGNAKNVNLLDTRIEPRAPIAADVEGKPSGDLAGYTS